MGVEQCFCRGMVTVLGNLIFEFRHFFNGTARSLVEIKER